MKLAIHLGTDTQIVPQTLGTHQFAGTVTLDTKNVTVGTMNVKFRMEQLVTQMLTTTLQKIV